MSGKSCKKPPPPQPPTIIEPLGTDTPAPTEIPVTAISKIYKTAGDPIRDTCAEAFGDAWSAWEGDEQAGGPPYETAALVCMTFDVGAQVLCVIASDEPTYTVDFADYIPAWRVWALDKLEVIFDWDYGHDNAPWQLVIKFNDTEYPIAAGVASIDIPAPISFDGIAGFKIIQNNTQPPSPCPTPVTRYTIIHEVTMIKAHWLAHPYETENYDDDPPPPPFDIDLGNGNGATPVISPTIQVTSGA